MSSKHTQYHVQVLPLIENTSCGLIYQCTANTSSKAVWVGGVTMTAYDVIVVQTGWVWTGTVLATWCGSNCSRGWNT